MRKICVVTGSRAEYGLLSGLMKAIRDEPGFQLQIIATGSHLSQELGMTHKEIEGDGFEIDLKVPMLQPGDTALSTGKSIGLGVMGCAEALNQLRPDLMVVLGDRFEILAAVQAALVARIPVAHLCGGDASEGAWDESIRHAITKMSHLHFVTHEAALRRVCQMGENPAHVYNFGSPVVDRIRETRLLTRSQFEKETGFVFQKQNFIVTFHPATLKEGTARDQFSEVLSALDRSAAGTGLIFTRANADAGGAEINAMMEEYAGRNPLARVFSSLGQLKYLSALSLVDLAVGNSSSGIYEMPFFKKPTVNIGDRQKGRVAPSSVVSSEAKSEAISRAIQAALSTDCSQVTSPYGTGNTVENIIRVLKSIPDYRALVAKWFFDLP